MGRFRWYSPSHACGSSASLFRLLLPLGAALGSALPRLPPSLLPSSLCGVDPISRHGVLPQLDDLWPFYPLLLLGNFKLRIHAQTALDEDDCVIRIAHRPARDLLYVVLRPLLSDGRQDRLVVGTLGNEVGRFSEGLGADGVAHRVLQARACEGILLRQVAVEASEALLHEEGRLRIQRGISLVVQPVGEPLRGLHASDSGKKLQEVQPCC
mmetsp:Transcript_17849/g.67764  ORF Transcript_17849/g.67764 Transcript_17849/m.67764 type:complete len:211 (-) Transcript_17849:1228-1860(-)